MIRAPPRFPLPLIDQRTFRAPSALGMTSPAKGLTAIQLMKSKRSSSDHIFSDCF